jgi:cysteine-rich repeat protein
MLPGRGVSGKFFTAGSGAGTRRDGARPGMRRAYASVRRPGICLNLRRAVPFAAGLGLLAVASVAAPPPLPGLSTVTIASPDTDLPIADNGSLTSLVTVSGVAGVVVDVDVSIDLVHPQADQLDVWLVSPSGTTVTLTTDNGGGNDDVFAGTVFDDQASGVPSAPNVRNFVYTNLVATGAIQPEEALGALVGEPANGPWALVVSDDSGGQTGMLRSWSLTISTVPSVRPSATLAFAGAGGPIPSNDPTGLASPVVVTGAGRYLYHLSVTLDITHPNSTDLDLFLTAPSGRRIDLVTDLGGSNDNIYAGTTIDDQAGMPASDTPLPPDGTPFPTVAGEGALSAFLGEDPNGTWTLTVVDDAAGNTGTLNGWTLSVVTAAVCGDGVLDAGEQCDDGNGIDGDGCDSNCTPTGCGNGVVSPGEDCDDGNTVSGDACPSTCHSSEVDCGDCVDNDGNGLVDAADPACAAAPLTLRTGAIARGARRPRGTFRFRGVLAVPSAPAGPVEVLLTDANGTLLCGDLGPLHSRGATHTARRRVAGGTIALKMRKDGAVTITGRGIDLSALDQPTLTLGLQLGGDRFLAGAAFRPWGGRHWVYP